MSELIPLASKTGSTLPSGRLLNPLSGTSLSTTPSPFATPVISRNISSLGNINIPSLSPAPSPLTMPSVVGGSSIQQSLSNLNALPPSPRLVGGSVPSSNSSIQQSLSNLNSLPPSPRLKPLPNFGTSDAPVRLPSSPSLDRLPGFESVSSLGSIKLPDLPLTGSLSRIPDSNLKPLVTDSTVILENSKSTASFHNYQGILQDSNIEQQLIESGYLPIDKILTKDENDNLMCQYIKALDPTGRSAFVDLDCEGYVSIDPKNMSVTKMSNKASVVPYSTKIGTYDCASSEVCGVAFECDNEICTVKRSDTNLAPTETVFTHVKNPLSSGHKHHGMVESHPIAYPIVSMSEIKNNPEAVTCSIKQSHASMRNVSFNQGKKETKELAVVTKDLHDEVKRYERNQNIVSTKLSKGIAELEQVYEYYKKRPPVNDKERELKRQVIFNLRKRHDLVIDHLKLSESVNSRVNRIKELAGEIKELNDYGDKLFKGIDNVYTE